MQLASAFQTSSSCFYLFEGRKKLIATAAPTPVPRLELATQKKRMLPDDLATLFGRADEEGAKLIFFVAERAGRFGSGRCRNETQSPEYNFLLLPARR